MITKGMREILGVREMFQNRAVLTAAQPSKVSPRATVQPVRTSLSGRRVDRRKIERALGPAPRCPGWEPFVGKSLGLAEPPLRLAAAPGSRAACRSRAPSLDSGSHHQLLPDSQATSFAFRFSLFRPSATQRCEALTLTATWIHPENTMLSGRTHTPKETQGVNPLKGNVQNR